MASRLRAEFNTSAIWCTGSCTSPNKTDFSGFAKASTVQKPDGEFNVHRQTDFQSCECNVIFSGYSFAFGLFKWQVQAGVTRYLITCLHKRTSEEMYGTYTFYYFFCILNWALKISGWMSTNSYLHCTGSYLHVLMPELQPTLRTEPKNYKSESSEKWSRCWETEPPWFGQREYNLFFEFTSIWGRLLMGNERLCSPLLIPLAACLSAGDWLCIQFAWNSFCKYLTPLNAKMILYLASFLHCIYWKEWVSLWQGK